jgi:hypothetical protein
MTDSQPDTANAEANNIDALKQYKDFVKLIAKRIPTFGPLNQFLNTPGEHHNLECKITSIRFKYRSTLHRECPINLKKKATDYSTKWNDLEQWLGEDCHQILLIENLTPCVLNVLGEKWEVSPEFFLSHLENSDWYKEQNIAEHLPALRSVDQSHIRFQFVAPREYVINGNSNALDKWKKPRKQIGLYGACPCRNPRSL